MDQHLADILDALDRYFDDEEAAALEQACTMAAARPVAIDELLDWLRQRRAEPARKDLATRRIRAALRLPAMPGAVCRPDPPA